jgi:hypothetical protein
MPMKMLKVRGTNSRLIFRYYRRWRKIHQQIFEKVANERSCSLAIEIDEQHAQQEYLIQNQLKVEYFNLNLKPLDCFRNLRNSYTMLSKIGEKT